MEATTVIRRNSGSGGGAPPAWVDKRASWRGEGGRGFLARLVLTGGGEERGTRAAQCSRKREEGEGAWVPVRHVVGGGGGALASVRHVVGGGGPNGRQGTRVLEAGEGR
jgi:hypothetical protein